MGRNYRKSRKSDPISQSKRSNLMRKIRSKNTKFELQFFELLKKLTKVDFKTNVKNIPGKPDIVFEKKRICIFLDSDFWHGWQYPRWKHLLKNDFWRQKIEKNRKRDKKVTRVLRQGGWKVLRFWEHELIHDSEMALKIISKRLN
jgi:DNA mismatch endonuclease (patch repair protein)